MQQYCETIPNVTPKNMPLNGAGLKFLNLEKSLIICADDFALNDGVSEAIVRLAGQGRISATSVLSLSPLWPEHARKLKDQASRVDVGLHLDLTSEFAVKAGYGAPLNQVLLKALRRGYYGLEMDEIIKSQLEKFESIWGAPPDHIDGHQHIHQFPGIRESLLRVLQAYFPGAYIQPQAPSKDRPWVRVAQVRPLGFKASIISLTGAQGLEGLLKRGNVNFTPYLLGVYEFNLNQVRYRQHFKNWLSSSSHIEGVRVKNLSDISDKSEISHMHHILQRSHLSDRSRLGNMPPSIMCHPATFSELGDPIGAARCVEFAYLSSQEFSNDLTAADLTLVAGSEFIRNNV